MNRPFFRQLVDFLRNHCIGDVLTRQQFLKEFKNSKCTEATIDTTRRQLTVVGILYETDKLGIYELAKYPEYDLTISQLTKQAYCVNHEVILSDRPEIIRKLSDYYLEINNDTVPSNNVLETNKLISALIDSKDSNAWEILYDYVKRNDRREWHNYNRHISHIKEMLK
ncbi:gp135 [Sphingomonas phage PAU]|uniref:gp135 n=1 Tax=Sphingomonas phage PAU TaxID=1150991 RepID=UPI000257327A|nr:gp135 [Sphingomonas phage PAU]AFF28133.1 gp135 [Sphingomonas phage PAU]